MTMMMMSMRMLTAPVCCHSCLIGVLADAPACRSSSRRGGSPTVVARSQGLGS